MAPSSLRGHSGFGVYTTRPIQRGDNIFKAGYLDGPAIAVLDPDRSGAGPHDDDDEVEPDGVIVPLFDGVLFMDDKILHYRGEGFHIESTGPLEWNLVDYTAPRPTEPYTVDPPYLTNKSFEWNYGTCLLEFFSC